MYTPRKVIDFVVLFLPNCFFYAHTVTLKCRLCLLVRFYLRHLLLSLYTIC